MKKNYEISKEQAWDILLNNISGYFLMSHTDDWGNYIMPDLSKRQVLKITSYGDDFENISIQDCIEILSIKG